MWTLNGMLYSFLYPAIAEIAPYVLGAGLLAGAILFIREARARRGRVPGSFSMFQRWMISLPLVPFAAVLALAHPQRFHAGLEGESLKGKAAVVVDESPSMSAMDVLASPLRARGVFPDRLALCTESLRDGLATTRGLTVLFLTFTESTNFRSGDWMQLATRRDQAMFASMLRSLRPSWIGSGTSLKRIFLELKDEIHEPIDFAVFCSDGGKGGSARSESPDDVLSALAEFTKQHSAKPVPFSVWGAGTPKAGGVPLPKVAPDGRVLGTLIVPNTNTEAWSEFDEGMLRRIAEITGGSYTRLRAPEDGAQLFRQAVLKSILRGNGVRVTSAEDLTWIPLIISFIAFLFATKSFSFLKGLFRRLFPRENG